MSDFLRYPLCAPASNDGDGAAGTELGRYRLLEKVGDGHLADTYRALSLAASGHGSLCFLDLIHEDVSDARGFRRAFAEEARLASRSMHPNLARVCDHGAHGSRHFLATEHLGGKRLDVLLQLLRVSRLRASPSFAVLIARDIARAAAAAHLFRDEAGRPRELLHGDIRPASIQVVSAKQAVLLGMATARLARALDRLPALERNCAYAAPEQLTGSVLDPRTDVFSIGAVLWELLTGEPLFTGATPGDATWNVIHAEVPPPSALVPGIPSSVDHVVLTALARDPSHRPRSARALAADLSMMVSRLRNHPQARLQFIPLAGDIDVPALRLLN